jgi:glycosyltransferase involved in cell wall biosynthesis
MAEIKGKFSVVVPVLNSKDHIRGCLDSILVAMDRYGNAELIVLDNGSEDGSYEILLNEYRGRVRVQQIRGIAVGALRNRGAALAEGEFIAFIDSDCVVVPDYFEQALGALRRNGADATGSEYTLEDSCHWIEETWYVIHTPSHDGLVKFITSGNLVIKRQAFLAINGFDERMISCEDMDLGVRLNKAGFVVYQAHAVRAFHPGGDKSLRVFFLKNAWRSMGMFRMLKNSWLFKPVLTLFAHVLLCTLAVANLFASHSALIVRVVISVGLINAAPLLTILYRAWRVKRLYAPFRSLLLYHIYFLSQLYALWNVMVSFGVSPEVKHARSARLHSSAKLSIRTADEISVLADAENRINVETGLNKPEIH